MRRRSFLAALAAAMGARPGSVQAARTRLIPLGTGGGPRPRTNSSKDLMEI